MPEGPLTDMPKAAFTAAGHSPARVHEQSMSELAYLHAARMKDLSQGWHTHVAEEGARVREEQQPLQMYLNQDLLAGLAAAAAVAAEHDDRDMNTSVASMYHAACSGKSTSTKQTVAEGRLQAHSLHSTPLDLLDDVHAAADVKMVS